MTLLLLALACKPDAGLTKFNSAPEAQITAPSSGSEVLEGTSLTLRGQASDPNHATGELLARWFVEDEEACGSAAPASDGTTTCEVLVPEGDTLIARLEVLDPEGSAGTAEASYPITPNQAPTASIASPMESGVYYSDQLVILRATVEDAEDAPDALSVRWESNRDGQLGEVTPNSEGLVESFVSLSEGPHAVQVFVTDTAGNEGQASVLIDVGPPNSAPGCAITAPLSGGASAEGERVDFTATASDVDIPANLLSVTWTSDKDGTLGTSTPDSAGNVAFSTGALSVDTHRVTMTVTDEVGASCASALTWTVGTPPEISLERPLSGEVANDGEALGFSALVSDREDVAADLTVRWESDRDGVFSEGAPDSGGLAQLVASTLSVGDHVLTVTVTDTAGLTATVLGTFSVNGIPSAPGVSLSPGAPSTTDDLVVRIDTASVDPDGDALSYGYRWLRDGVASGASTSATLPASATADGETWTVEVWASDGLAESPLGSTSVTIANTAPTLGSVAITPDPARRTDTLTCTPSGASDADGDSIAYTYRWTVDGVAAGSGATLTGPFVVGALIACTVTPNDGKDPGAARSDSATIVNSLPVVSSVTLSPGSVYTNDTLTASVVSSDADGDSVSLRYRWFIDGVELAGATGASLSGAAAGSFGRDDVVTVEVTPNDGVADGAALTSTGVTVGNTAPTTPGIAITPASPEAGDDLTCSVVPPSTDADGDEITYSFAWDVDGTSYGSGASAVAGADVGAGETWTCEVVAGDGGATASAVVASVTTGGACGALYLDGVDDYLTFPTHSLGDTDFTIEAWVLPGTDAMCQGTLISWGTGIPTFAFSKYHSSVSTSYNNFLSVEEVGHANVTSTTAYVSSGAWHHIAVTHRGGMGVAGSAFTFFVDGVAHTSPVAGGTLTLPTGMGGYIGRQTGRYGGTCTWQGTIDSIRVSNTRRYTGSYTIPSELLLDGSTTALWDFNEGSGTLAADSSGYGANATLVGGTWRTGADCR